MHAPRTLLVRSVLLIALLLAASLGSWFLILKQAERGPRAEQLAQQVSSTVNLTRAALLAAQPDRRLQLLFDLADIEEVEIYLAEESDELTPMAGDPLTQLIADGIRQQLGKHTRLASARNGNYGFWVSFHIDDDLFWLKMPRERVLKVAPSHWMLWAALAGLLSLAGAWWIVRLVDRPIKSLVASANAIGQGRAPTPLPDHAPSEIQALAAAIHRMHEELDRIARERAEVLAGISHDLRTPLARLRLALEMAVDDETLRDELAGDVSQMDAIIGQFLDYARQDDGEAITPCDPAALLVHCGERSGLRFVPQIDATPPLLPLRPKALSRCIWNLVANARNYAGGIEAVRLWEDNEGVHIAVTDNGPGIPEAQSERLKQPFTRLNSARTDSGGAGLGLAIVDRSMRQMGGRFDLYNRKSGGLEARLTLPTSEPN